MSKKENSEDGARSRGTKGPRGAPDGSNKINVAGMHKDELLGAIESANPSDLRELEAQLEKQGWAKNGMMRRRVAERFSEIGG